MLIRRCIALLALFSYSLSVLAVEPCAVLALKKAKKQDQSKRVVVFEHFDSIT